MAILNLNSKIPEVKAGRSPRGQGQPNQCNYVGNPGLNSSTLSPKQKRHYSGNLIFNHCLIINIYLNFKTD